MPANGTANLIPASERTPEERRANGIKGGIKSGEVRRRAKTLREIAKAMLEAELMDSDEAKKKLKERGFDSTYGDAMLMAQLDKARRGDTEAARFVRDTSGQKPAEAIELGNLDGRPFEALDLSSLSDEQLKELASRRCEEG